VIVGLALLPVAYRYRHQLRRVAHNIVRGGDSSIHSGPPITNSVEFNGRQFRDVLGVPPYYLDVPQLHSVLFVTRVNDGGTNAIHILDRQTGRDVEIPTIADFGRSIGLTNGPFLEYVETVEPGKISVASESGIGPPTKTVFHLNLQTAKMDSRDIFHFDRNGTITNTQHAPGF